MDEVKQLEAKLDDVLETVTDKLKAMKDEVVDGHKLTDEKIGQAVADMKKANDDYLESVKKNNVSLDMEKKDIDKFSFGRAMKGILNDDWKDGDYEKDVLRQTKAQDTNSGAAGSYLIPVELAKDKIVMPAIENTVMKRAGATFWDGLVGDLDIPEATNRPSLTWASDGSSATLNTVNYALQPMRPKTGNMLTKVSNKLWHQTAGFIEQNIVELMREGVEVGLDNIALNGTGSESQPRGILNVSGTNTLDVSSARMTQDDVGVMIEDVQEQDFLKDGNTALITRPKVLGGLRREKVKQYSTDTGGMPIVVPMMSDTRLSDFTGTQVLTTTNVAIDGSNLTKAVLGEWSKFKIATWAGMRLRRSDVAGDAFADNQTWFVIFVDADSRATHPLAFNIASNVLGSF